MVLCIHTRREQRSLFSHFKCELGEEQNSLPSDKIFPGICSCSGKKTFKNQTLAVLPAARALAPMEQSCYWEERAFDVME